MTQRRCHACRTFHDIKLPECPNCQTPKHAYNPHAYKTKLDNHLTGQVAGQAAEMQRYRELKGS